jgi:effector-binding domain-containing protein
VISPVQVVEVPPCPLAAVRGHASPANLSRVIRDLFDRFYRAPPPVARGLNVVFYHGDPTGAGTTIDAGVQVSEPFQPSGEVIAVSTPGGTAATVAYFGPYEALGEAYDAIFQWLRDNHRQAAGPFWEVYGHWNDDPAQRRTDVFSVLK